MESDWSVAAAAADPVIEVAWEDAASGLAWSDLCIADPAEQQRRIAALAEAASSPVMTRALTLLNAPRGLLLTTKCDRWPMDEDELAEHANLLDAPATPYGYGSYIDILMAHPLPMSDFLLHEEWARLASRRAAALPIESARMEVVVRPARQTDTWGFGLSIYCYGAGADPAAAEAAWAAALDAVIPVLVRSAGELVPAANDFGA